MAMSNWLELAALLLGIAAGLVLWRACKRKLKRESGFEGIATEHGRLARRQQLDAEEEIKRLKARLGRK
ncbi:MAG: hypothetical protein FWH26_01345 [Oscillospiraceae bacterium]|nr:hypothetical protein [Oscillospiraceae bacterium]